MPDSPPPFPPDQDEDGYDAGIRRELFERRAKPVAAAIGRVLSAACAAGSVGVFVALVRVFAVRPLPDVDVGSSLLTWAVGGAILGAASLFLVRAESPNPWWALRGRVREFRHAKPFWAWFGLALVLPATVAMTTGWAVGTTLEVLQLPETTTGTVTGGTVTTTVRKQRYGGETSSTSSSVTYEFKVLEGPHAGTYRGSGGLSGSAEIDQTVGVRYDPDAPWRNRLSTKGSTAYVLPWCVAGAVLFLWLGFALFALLKEGCRPLDVVLFTLAHTLLWVALGTLISHGTFGLRR